MSEKPKEPLDTDPHPDYASLTYGDVKKAKQSALLKAEKARRDAAIKKIEAAEVERLMQEEGISTEEMVEIVLEGSPDQPWFSTNGKRFPINQRGDAAHQLHRTEPSGDGKAHVGQRTRSGDRTFVRTGDA